jgi:hypothetical protein
MRVVQAVPDDSVGCSLEPVEGFTGLAEAPLDVPPEDSAAVTVALAVDVTPSLSPPPGAEQPAASPRSPAASTVIRVALRNFGTGG